MRERFQTELAPNIHFVHLLKSIMRPNGPPPLLGLAPAYPSETENRAAYRRSYRRLWHRETRIGRELPLNVRSLFAEKIF